MINKVNSIENNIQELKNKNNKLEKEIENLKNNTKSRIDNAIIKDEELNLIEEAIKNKFHTNIKRYELLLRGSRDGFHSNNFHQKCDGKNNTITFILTKYGRRFGGFTEATWDQSGQWKKYPNSFIFSLDNKEIYYIKNNANCILCYKNGNPNFLGFGEGHDFKLYNNCNENNCSYDNSGVIFETNGKKYALAGSYNFSVKDYEVFQLLL